MNTVFHPPSLKGTDKLSRYEMTELGILNSGRFCLALGGDITIVVAAIALSEHVFFNPFLYILSVILIGSRLHALGVLMHDCVHYRAFNTRKLNMIFGELLAWPVLLTAEGYRSHHLSHHRYLNTQQDPDWARKATKPKFHFPKRKWEVLQALLYQVCGLGILELFLDLRKSALGSKVSMKTRLSRLGFYLVILTICVYTGTMSKLALYWVVPMLTTFPVANYIRSVAEHHGNLEYDHTYTNSRTTIPNWWESFLFLPHHVGYHLEHHLYPHVPFYRLKDLHQALMQRYVYEEKAHITHGVCTGLLKEWVATARGPSVLEIQKQQDVK